MLYDINKLLQSENKPVKKFAWFLFEREGKDVLDQNDISELLQLINGLDRYIEKEKEDAYNEGVEDRPYCDCF